MALRPHIFAPAAWLKLLEQGAENAKRRDHDGNTVDYQPVVKLFTPWAGATWLISEIEPGDPDVAFGLADLGLGSPEMGSIYMPEVLALRGPGGLRVEVDRWFEPTKTLTEYWEAARNAGCIQV